MINILANFPVFESFHFRAECLYLYDATLYKTHQQGPDRMTLAINPDARTSAALDDPLSGSLCHELRKTSVAVMAAMSGEFGQWDLKPSEANLLKYVGANPGCTQSNIARAHRNNATNLVSLIARLERDGLLERTRASGRAIALSISEKGAALLIEVEAGFRRLEEQLGASLTDDQHAQLIQALRTICKAACHYNKA